MAAADSQAKTISLVIFVVLTVITSCLAYYFWNQTDMLTQQAQAAKKSESEANQKAATTKKEYEELRQSIGIEPKDSHASVMTLVNADLQTAKTNDERRRQKPTYAHYTDALKYLHGELDASDKRVAAAEKDATDLRDKLKTTKETYDAEVAKYRQAQEAAKKDLGDEQSKFLAQLGKKDEENDELRNQNVFLRDKVTQLTRDIEDTLKKGERERIKDQAIIDNLKREAERRQTIQFEHKDAEIILVQEAGNAAQIDIGLDDGVRQGLTFGVYGRDVGGNPYKLPKANAEVVRILGPHKSLVKITGNSITNTILPGDLLFNPVWSPGDRESVAIVGKIYMDDDNEPDNERFMQLIRDLGGKVDSWVDLKTGKVMGKPITTQTGWLVEGEIPDPSEKAFRPEETKLDKEIFRSSDTLKRQAREAGVRIVNARNFLTYMGYQALQQTIPYGREYQFLHGKRRPRLVDKLPEDQIKEAEREPPRAPAGGATTPPAK